MASIASSDRDYSIAMALQTEDHRHHQYHCLFSYTRLLLQLYHSYSKVFNRGGNFLCHYCTIETTGTCFTFLCWLKLASYFPSWERSVLVASSESVEENSSSSRKIFCSVRLLKISNTLNIKITFYEKVHKIILITSTYNTRLVRPKSFMFMGLVSAGESLK